MSKIALTGAQGFLGWHTRTAASSLGLETAPITVGELFDLDVAAEALEGATRVVHIAGVNRGDDDAVRDGNLRFAEQLATALRRTTTPPRTMVFANSTQVGNGSPYAVGKSAAADILSAVADELDLEFIDVRLPNLFGEHGRPHYNSVVATFAHTLSRGGVPEVQTDRELVLLHAQDAADVLLGKAPLDELTYAETVSGLLDRLARIASDYSSGTLPDLSERLQRDLFNTYRSFLFEVRPTITLTRNADARGAFFEVVRSRGGAGQSSFSTTAPGVTRGEHFHRRKVERFTVIAGRARIALRRLYSTEVVELEVDGDHPVAVDMPTMWAHRITNTGGDLLYTSFWSNEIFDSQAPDTYPEVVQ